MTGGCTKQACSFRDDDGAARARKGVEVVGVSGDSVENHQVFKKAHELNFTLLADPEGVIARAFGVKTDAAARSRSRRQESNSSAASRQCDGRS